VCPLSVRSKSPVSNSHILTVPSSEEVASWVYCGWNASEVMLPLCPLSSNLGGVLSR
jgi:hypothetical protein